MYLYKVEIKKLNTRIFAIAKNKVNAMKLLKKELKSRDLEREFTIKFILDNLERIKLNKSSFGYHTSEQYDF